MLQPVLHYGLHFVAPLCIALIFFRRQWKTVFLLVLATMLVDLDHLLTNPIFDPNRCSIGFHLLHSYWAVIAYVALLFFKKTRVVGIGLVLHMIADAIDCLWMM